VIDAPQAAAPLEPSDRRELARIVRVYAREWMRSRRRPPGAPHRAALLAEGGAWLRLRATTLCRSALHLAVDRPLYLVLGELGAQLAEQPPPLLPADLAAVGLDILALGRPVRLAGAADIRPGQHGVLLVTAADHALIEAPGTEGLTVPEIAGRLCGQLCLPGEAAGDPAHAWYAFVGESFSSP